jgi:tetratricopeptide (TPR) repeat protein
MVSLLSKSQITRTFQLRMGLLDKSAFPTSGDSEEPAQIVKPNLTGKPAPINREKARSYTKSEQEYAALYSEGTALYQRREYSRAIAAFSEANDLNVEKPNPNILIDRADCYIHIGMPELALEDVNRVLSENKNNPRAILTKAEAYFSMGEFEFALVFFQRGLFIRKDISGFRDGVAKAKHAILDAIHGKSVFQPNPNYALSRPRKSIIQARSAPLNETKENEPTEEPEPTVDVSKLLPEKVPPLSMACNDESFLGELSLDYEFLEEIKTEIECNSTENNEASKEDEEIKKIVDSTLNYLKQRGAFWSQQGKCKPAQEDTKERTVKSPKKKSQKKSSTNKARYEMSKLQQYENKYGDKNQEEEEQN